MYPLLIGRAISRIANCTGSSLRWLPLQHKGSKTCFYRILLHHMCQLMRQQLLPLTSLRSILPPPKDHITPYCIRQRIHRLRRFCRLPISMHPHLAEIRAKTRLHKRPRSRVQCLTIPAAQDLIDNRWSGTFCNRLRSPPLQSFAFRRARLTFSCRSGNATTGTFSLYSNRRSWNSHDVLRRPVSLLLIGIILLANSAF